MPKKNYSKFYILATILAAVVLLIFLNYIGWLSAPKNIIFKISTPVFYFFQRVGLKISGTTKLFFNLNDLAKKNENLAEKNRQLLLRLTNLSQIKNENSLLRLQLQVEPPSNSRLVLADIIGYDPGNLGNYVLINCGQSVGVKVNQAVIYAGGYLVGKIAEVNENLSKVMVLSDSDSAVFAVTQESKAGGVIRGDHGVGLTLDMVPFEKKPISGEIVVSSGLGGDTPKNLIIGKIETRISSESEAFQKFKIEPIINYREIESVFVIIE